MEVRSNSNSKMTLFLYNWFFDKTMLADHPYSNRHCLLYFYGVKVREDQSQMCNFFVGRFACYQEFNFLIWWSQQDGPKIQDGRQGRQHFFRSQKDGQDHPWAGRNARSFELGFTQIEPIKNYQYSRSEVILRAMCCRMIGAKPIAGIEISAQSVQYIKEVVP